ncbi:Protein kinase domain-containing protein [Mycena indigotica]|uniref:Protein kinase domain-containing protein n=1 Tax=Mycena indigotica TaxID=2126181 RepID=A0A8H6SAN1_9AGAR|nr:Protein kinase domain-containing protein [Mycena indigotica]KAF7295462.1 Protein kinase domain-containing protein [Mycena indigotica]
MAPTRRSSPRISSRAPPGYNHKRIVDGLTLGARYRRNYAGVHDGKEPFYPPLPLPIPKDIQPADPRGPGLTLNDLECVKALGRGGNGSVLLVRTRGPAAEGGSKVFALKAVGKKALRQRENSEIDNDNSRERTALVTMDWHPFVCGLLQTFYDERNIYFLLEYGSGGSFSDLITTQNRPMTPAQMVFYFANIMCGLEHLEKSGIVHRDLKPGNILVGADGYLLICDFGPSMFVPEPGASTNPGTSFANGEGTTMYQAPEAFIDGHRGQPPDVRYGTAIDWWSAGVILYEMATNEFPYDPQSSRKPEQRIADAGPNIGEEMFALIHSRPFQWPAQIRVGRKLKNLISGLLTINANERLGACGGFDEVRQHPWLVTVDWPRMRRKWYLPPTLDTRPFPDRPSKPVKRSQYPGLHFVESS